MASLFPGFEYDIFVSYRQKDNKYDGWVTEFVDHLNRELEATFKEEISVYFDINPHDGLLETHDVDASLEEKLKCLIFIPIISRTYCDPKSFAWDHEFRAFVNQASHDRFGLKIKLPSGNVANRVLPIRIHDLDSDDVKLCESVIGGFLRGVDFIYRSAGVNRPLRAHEDHPHDNQNKMYYRDQINKVANAIDEIIMGLKKSQHKPAEELIVNLPNKKIQTENKGLEKKLTKVEKITNTFQEDKPVKVLKLKKKPWLYRTFALFLFLAILSGAWYIHNNIKVKQALTKNLPEIERLYNEFNFKAAYDLIRKTEKIIPKDPDLRAWSSRIITRFTILTDPPGADVYFRDYSDPVEEWEKLGTTPIDSIRLPVFTFFQVKLEKAGYDTVMALMATTYNPRLDTLQRILFRKGTLPQGMVYVEGYWDEVKNIYVKENGFFIDRYEVTNKQYKEFVDKGGYRNPEFWKNDFIRSGKKLAWEEAMAEFIDKTGRPGPSTWEAGDYPEGQDDYPVSGISWYEAAAYAEFSGKSLPTADHWDSGAGFWYSLFHDYVGPKIFPLSNFNGKGPEPVGKNPGITIYGACDMAGNVREWCWNETGNGRIIAGGGYDDATYLYTSWSQLPVFDRSAQNGFRCVLYMDKEKIPLTAFRAIDLMGDRIDYTKTVPVSEDVFNIFRNQFLYDSSALDAKITERDETPEDWTIEKVTLIAAYGNETLIAYLFLPKNAAPPYQTLVFFPGSYALEDKDLKTSKISFWFIDFILKSGRAVMYPVYKGTFERKEGGQYPSHQSHEYTERLIQWVKDVSRSIDYLEIRPDIDIHKLGFYGHSWGGWVGGIIPAIEDRLKINILITGGYSGASSFPESNELNYVPRIRIPVLMLNGRYDGLFDLDMNVRPFFDHLGTPVKDKRLCVYETGHYVSKSDMIRETLGWLDKYFGPVNQSPVTQP
jgi:dienelactone hydrolase